MRAGRLRHKITIQQPTAGGTTGYGATVAGWTSYATPWAGRDDSAGREFVASGRESQEEIREVPAVWEIRYDSGVTAGMRISWDSRTWDIHSVHDPDGGLKRRLFLVSTENK